MEIPESFKQSSYAQAKFQHIVQWAQKNHPFYQRKWAESLPDINLLTREEILDHNDLLLNGHPVTGQTSGSTGIPVKISWSNERKSIEQKVTQRFVEWLGGSLPALKIIHLKDDQKGHEFLEVNSPVSTQIETILENHQRFGTIGITTYPTNAERLCQAIIEQQLDMSFIQRFGCYAEVFEPFQEDLIQQAFPNARIWSTYSSTEFGMIAARCPHEPDFHHIFAGKLGVEILDQDGRPCRHGEVGRVVITDYFNTHSPLIRYEIGDLAARGECPCGKIHFPALTSIKGKVRGALVHRNGERVPFTQLSVALRDIPGMRQYQVIQHELDNFTLRFVSHLKGAELEQLKSSASDQFYRHFGYTPAISFEQESEIMRGENGKFYASISYV